MADEPKIYKKELRAGVEVTGAMANLVVTRGLNGIRLAVLGIVVSVGLGSAALEAGLWPRLLAGFGAFALSCALLWIPHTRNWLMKFAHSLTGV